MTGDQQDGALGVAEHEAVVRIGQTRDSVPSDVAHDRQLNGWVAFGMNAEMSCDTSVYVDGAAAFADYANSH